MRNLSFLELKLPIAWLLSCEHAGFAIPSWVNESFKVPEPILTSHRGWDIGAWKVASKLAKALGLTLFGYPYTRLLIEANRSLTHPNVYSEYSLNLEDGLKARCENWLYHPYRDRVRQWIQKATQTHLVVHLSIHSFTPLWEGQHRKAQFGLLYDPRREEEKLLSKALIGELKTIGYDARSNYPYLGRSDGHTSSLRRIFKQRYLGIEVEINQKLLSNIENTVKVVHVLQRILKGP